MCFLMVKFESLELIGFKSFADKVQVIFPEGITAIIGPNGCGKSNLADAIGWVLGEQSARTLRGARMEDVIFNGTQTRKPSGVVEVTLRLKRTGEPPLVLEGTELTGDTLEISRKLYRSGESLYLINQRRCRLKDIEQLMEEAGLGYASYALIEQGRIDAVLNARPLERRAIIEEAAQILGYKAKRRNAELKLEMARQNLLRVNDIVLEVERQLRSLKRQAARARRYRELKEEFQQMQRRKFALEAEHLRSQLRIVDAELADLRTAEETLRSDLALREKAYRDSVEKRDQLESHLTALRQRRSELHLEVDRTENSIQYHQEQIQLTQRQLQSNAAEQQSIAQSLERVLHELERFRFEQARLEEEEAKVEAALEEQKQLVERYRADLEQAETSAEEMRSSLLFLAAEIASLSNLKEQLEQRLQTGSARRERLERERATHLLQRRESASALAEKRRAVESREAEIGALREQLLQQEESKKSLEKLVEDLKEQTGELHNQGIALRERLQSLQEIELKHSQYSEGVQQFLNHLSRSQSIRASGTLADFVETHPAFERLVEEFLNQELEYVLVESLDDALKGVTELKALNSGKCTFLSLHSCNGFGKGNGKPQLPLPREEGVFGTVGELLHMKAEVQEAFHRVLPQHAEAIVVSNLDRAFQLAHGYHESTFVTLEGEQLAPRGLLSASAGQSQKLGLLALKREKRELEERILAQQKSLAAVSQRLEEEQKQFESVSALHVRQQQELYEGEKQLIALAHQQQQWQAEEERQDQALRVLADEIQQLDLEQQQQRDRVRQIERDLSGRQAARAEAEAILSETQKSLQQLKTEFSRVQEQLHLVSSDGKVMQERRVALERTVERIEEQRRNLESRREAAVSVQRENEERLIGMTATLEKLRRDLESYREEVRRSEVSLAESEQDYTRWKETHHQLEELLSQLRDRRTQLQEERARLDVEWARLETQLQNLSEQCLEQLQTPLGQAAEGLDLGEMTLEQILGPYSELKTRLDEFGPLNMTALEEYQENEERYSFLTAQKQDLEQSIADTTRAIQEMNRRSREKFREAFDAINRHFQEVFQFLFGGGECGMQLLDESDLLESGIEICAQPPGKKLQNVMLLSGGEKALTALALLVALFRYRPSRFCLFDEVDAPLDDANVGRFAALVRQMSRQTQFIIITHNKQTMEIADSLYGVTMEEPGISQLVSVRF